MKFGKASPKVVHRLPDSGVVVVKTSAVQGMRQMRCPRCQNMAGPVKTGNGKVVTRCATCGAEFGTQKI